MGTSWSALNPSRWASVIYLLVGLAALVRVGFAALNFHLIAWLASAACWIIASIIFVSIYAPILWRNSSR